MNRREFIGVLAAAGLLAACGKARRGKKIGLALGGGGAKGLAHIPMLEVFDELGIVPHHIAGTSIGAVIGSLYASGMSGRELRQLLDSLTVSKDEGWLNSFMTEEISRWWDFLELRVGRGGLVNPDALMAFLAKHLKVTEFGKLKIPLKIVAADFWDRGQVVLDAGDLLTAVRASMAIPGLFEPVRHRDKFLVDGGLVNPVPYDLLFDECDVVVAVNVLGERTPESNGPPGYFETTFNAFQILQSAILREKLRHRPPHIYVKPDIRNIRVLEFYKAGEIYRQAETARRELAGQLRPYRATDN